MLDLSKLAGQMRGLSQHLTAEAEANRQRLQLGQKHLENAFSSQDELVQIQQKWRDRILFANATPVEPLHTCIDIMVPPKTHTVIATDGSQIAPNHHEIAYCYLLNIGRVVLHYGQNKHPILDSLPEVFYRPEDLYMSRQWGIRTEEWMSYRRTASEAVVLSELAIAATAKGQRDGGTKGWGDGERGRGGEGERGRWGEGERGRWGDGERGRWGEGERGRRGDYFCIYFCFGKGTKFSDGGWFADLLVFGTATF